MTVATTQNPAPAIDGLDWLAQRCAAAEELWTLGYTPESYAILCHGLTDASALVRGCRDLPAELLEAVETLLAEAKVLGAPLSRDDFTREHAAWLERARALSHRLQRVVSRSRKPSPRRMSPSVVLSALLLVLAAFGFRAWERSVYAYASATYAPEFAAANAVDGQRTTEWLLPDGAAGQLDISLATRRVVHEVTITNSHNRQFMDRATKRALILVFDDKHQVDRAEVSFEGIEERAVAKRIPLKGVSGTRVRVQILEHFGFGAGLADIEVD